MGSKFRSWRIFGTALAAVLFATTPASADPISAAIAAIVSSISSITVAGVIAFAAQTAIGIGLSYLVNAVFGAGKQTAPVQGISGTIQTGGVVPRSFLVGEYATAGSLGYVNTWGQVDKTPNSYFTMRVDLADLPMHALTEIWVGDIPCTYDTGGTPTAWGYPVPEFRADGVDYLWVKFYNGAQTIADPWLVSQFGSDPNYPYSSDMVGYGCAYMIVTARLNPNLFSGFPQYKAAGEGITLYDLRQDSENGGSGSQRFDDPSTWGYSNNAAEIIYNLLKGIRYGDQWLFGLQGMTAPRLPASSWIAGLNEADLPTPKHDGGYEPQYRAGGEIQVSAQPIDVITEFLNACNGRVAEVGGSYKILVGAAGAPVMYLTDDDIVTTEQQTFNPFPTLSSTVNGVTAHYPEPAQGWANVDAPALYNPDLEIRDRDRRLLVEVTYGCVPYFEQVQRLEISAVNEARRFRRHSWTLPPICWLLEPNDVVRVNSNRNSYVDKDFRLDALTDNSNLDVPAALTECDPSDYSYNPATQFQPRTNGPLVIAAPTPQAVLSWAAEGVVIRGDDGKERPGILLAWDNSSDDVKGVKFEVKHVATGQVLSGQTFDYAAGQVTIDLGFLPNTLYQVRGILIPGSNRDVEWSDWLDVTTPDTRITYDELSDDIQSDLDLAESLLPRVDAVEVATGKAATAVRALTSDQIRLQNVILGLQAKIPKLEEGQAGALALAKEEIYQYTDGQTTAIAQHLLVLEAQVEGITSIGDLAEFQARLVAVETATADLETSKASVESVETLDAQINTPDTGLAAQVAFLNTVVADLDPDEALATIQQTATAARAHGLSLQSMGNTILGILSKLNKLEAGQSISLAYYRSEITAQVVEGVSANADAIGQLGVLMQTADQQLQASITTEQHTRADGDTANAAVSTSILAALAGYTTPSAVSAAFISETNARVAGDGASASRLDVLEAAMTGYTGSSAIATAFTSTNANVGTAQGTANSASSAASAAQSTANSAASAASAAQGTANSASSAASAAQGTANSASSAASAAQGTANSASSAAAAAQSSADDAQDSIGGSYSPSNTVSTALIAQASRIDGVEAGVDGATAGGYISFVAQSAPGGVSARAALVVYKDDGSGHPGSATTSALLLDAMPDGSSRALLLASQIYLVNGSDAEAIDGILSFVGGVLTVDAARITGTLDVGTLIADNAIITGKLEANAVTDQAIGSNSISGGVSTSFVDLCSATYDTTGAPLHVFASWRTTISYIGTDSGGAYEWQLLRGATVIDSGNGLLPFNPGTLNEGSTYGLTDIIESPSAGSVTYTLQVRTATGNGIDSAKGTITVVEFKR